MKVFSSLSYFAVFASSLVFLPNLGYAKTEVDLQFFFSGQDYRINQDKLNSTVKFEKNVFDQNSCGAFKVSLYARETNELTFSCSDSWTSAFDDLIAEKVVDPYFGFSAEVNFDEAELDDKIWPIFAGISKRYCLYAILDSGSQVNETNESNNLYTFSAPFNYPVATPTPTPTPSPTSLEPVSVSSEPLLSFYPNPVLETLNLSESIFKTSALFRIEIIDPIGRIVFIKDDLRPEKQEAQIAMPTLPSGFYLFRVTSENNTIFQQKFLKQE